MKLNKDRFLYLIVIILPIVVHLLFRTLPLSAKDISLDISFLEKDTQVSNKGIWVTCFSKKKALYSKDGVIELIEFCKSSHINEVYLQFYRADKAYYDSKRTDRSKYEAIVKSAGIDTIDLLLEEADKNKIKVFAWINILSLAQNKKANIISKFGSSVLTKDQYLRSSIRGEGEQQSDRYYLRDNQLYLEPGDLWVQEYILSIVKEIITQYPALKGIHLDYIRYPYPIPFLPRSNFNRYGLTYGYGERNILRFREKTGLDPLSMKDVEDNFLHWDNWKREQVTFLVESISKEVKKASPDLLISCAVVPSPETAYSAAFQDWSKWLEEGIIDYVVLMNYTRDNYLVKTRVKSALYHRAKGRIFIGLGAFLMKDDPELFLEQYKIIEDLGPDGIVFFSYDDIKN